MPRKPRPLDRDGGVVRDASMVVIASEDEHAVKVYFERFQTKRMKVLVLPTLDCNSSPGDVVRRLDEFKKEYATEDHDQFWYCGDTDHWIQANHIGNLRQVLQHCRHCEYHVALSNPCFELWLFLHFADVDVPQDVNCNVIRSLLSPLCNGYSKRKGCAKKITAEMVYEAIRRAKLLNGVETDIPTQPATQVYLIIEELIRRESINL